MGSLKRIVNMPRTCALTGKTPARGRSYTTRGIAKKKKGIGLNITGKNKRRFQPNLKKKRFYIPEEKRFVTLRVSASAMRTIDKWGIEKAMKLIRSENR
jgi:large subunit ribosomal protein L28